MFLEIVTPLETLFSGEVKKVKVPGTGGSFGILKNHAPIISSLIKGEVKIIDTNGKEDFFKINGGVVEVLKNNVIILASL